MKIMFNKFISNFEITYKTTVESEICKLILIVSHSLNQEFVLMCDNLM